MWYKIDWNKLVLLLLPTFLRQKTIVAYMQALVQPVATLHYNWLRKREDHWYKLNHTGQVCYLKKVLNDALDPDERRIYIADGNAFPRKYIYTRAENKPIFLGKMHIYQHQEYTNTGADFVVFVPTAIEANEPHRLKYLIEFYKLASKRYQIRTI